MTNNCCFDQTVESSHFLCCHFVFIEKFDDHHILMTFSVRTVENHSENRSSPFGAWSLNTSQKTWLVWRHLEDHPSYSRVSNFHLQAIKKPFRRGPTTRSVGDENDHHGYLPLTSTGMILQADTRIILLGFVEGNFSLSTRVNHILFYNHLGERVFFFQAPYRQNPSQPSPCKIRDCY